MIVQLNMHVSVSKEYSVCSQTCKTSCANNHIDHTEFILEQIWALYVFTNSYLMEWKYSQKNINVNVNHAEKIVCTKHCEHV